MGNPGPAVIADSPNKYSLLSLSVSGSAVQLSLLNQLTLPTCGSLLVALYDNHEDITWPRFKFKHMTIIAMFIP